MKGQVSKSPSNPRENGTNLLEFNFMLQDVKEEEAFQTLFVFSQPINIYDIQVSGEVKKDSF